MNSNNKCHRKCSDLEMEKEKRPSLTVKSLLECISHLGDGIHCTFKKPIEFYSTIESKSENNNK